MRRCKALLFLLVGACADMKPGTDVEDTGVGCSGPECAYVVRLSIGAGDHSCVLLSDQSLRCWGRNDRGQLGQKMPSYIPTPEAVPNVGAVQELSLGGASTCVIRRIVGGGGTSNDTWCWGRNDLGQLADGNTRDQASPARSFTYADFETTLAESAVYLRLGGRHGCLRGNRRNAYCWGEDELGQSGAGTVSSAQCGSSKIACRVRPTRVRAMMMSSFERVEDLASGEAHTCALQDGDVFCWGGNEFGELGLPGDTLPHPTPSMVSALTMEGATRLALGGRNSCALTPVGILYCWGDNRYGQLGKGTVDLAPHPAPTALSALRAPIDVTVGGGHVCAHLADQSLWCWGRNDSGQVGNGTTTVQTVPQKVMDAVVEAAAGAAHTCVRRTDQTIYCWGRNDVGQLGLGRADGEAHPMPVRIMERQ